MTSELTLADIEAVAAAMPPKFEPQPWIGTPETIAAIEAVMAKFSENTE